MASRAKVLANRRNAARSTGPWTAEGKSRSAQNARRYGFARPLIDIALQSGATVIEINLEATDACSDGIHLQGPSGQVLPRLVDML